MDILPVYKKVNGEWAKQTAFRKTSDGWEKISESKVESRNLHFISPTDGVVKFVKKGTQTQKYTLQYSYDDKTWNNYTLSNNVNIYANEPIYWKGTLSSAQSSANYITFSTDVEEIHAYGEVDSLLGFGTLLGQCYSNLFYNCSTLKTAPKLPATTLAQSCYNFMFSGCTSLVNAPELPATTLTENCYYNMFSGCTSLVNAPELPATTLALDCYRSMFDGCSNLKYIKLLYTDLIYDNYFKYWVSGVSSTGDFYYNGTDTTRGVSTIPNGWTIHTF